MKLRMRRDAIRISAGLIELKHWARAIPIAPERITYHVLESTDPAGQLIDYARNNRVDHIIIGARGSSALRRYLGSVSARVVAEAPCTVTVVRPAREDRSDSAQRSRDTRTEQVPTSKNCRQCSEEGNGDHGRALWYGTLDLDN